MKVSEYLVVPKKFLTPRAGILEQQEPDRDPVVYRRGATFGGLIYFRRMVKDRENVSTRILRYNISMTLSTGCSSTSATCKLRLRFRGLGGPEKLRYVMHTSCGKRLGWYPLLPAQPGFRPS